MCNERYEKDDWKCSVENNWVKKWTKECENSWKQLLNNWIFNYTFFKKRMSDLVDKYIHVSAAITVNKAWEASLKQFISFSKPIKVNSHQSWKLATCCNFAHLSSVTFIIKWHYQPGRNKWWNIKPKHFIIWSFIWVSFHLVLITIHRCRSAQLQS